jgi:hypothetical protein
MRTTRLWMARALVVAAAGVVLMIVGVPGCDSSSGPVSGRVSYNGRPVTGGLVLFYPVGGVTDGIGSGRIDKNGVYSVNPDWLRPGMGQYRICVLPGDGPRLIHRHPMRRANRPSHVVLASFGPEPTDSEDEDEEETEEERFLSRYGNVEASILEVSLGPESACIDIDIKD